MSVLARKLQLSASFAPKLTGTSKACGTKVMHAFKGPAALAVQATKTGRLWFSFPPSLVYKWEYQATGYGSRRLEDTLPTVRGPRRKP